MEAFRVAVQILPSMSSNEIRITSKENRNLKNIFAISRFEELSYRKRASELF